MNMGNIFNIQKFCTNDGPGIRTTIFFKGCYLNCVWCHNPESILFKENIDFKESLCNNCNKCKNICESNVHSFIEIDNKLSHNINIKNCVMCKKCIDICVTKALSICGGKYNTEELINIIKADIPFYNNSNGGVTLSGGEALIQDEFCYELLYKLKKLNIHTCIETSGYLNYEKFSKVNDYVDLYLYDYKLTNEEIHKKYTGVSNKLILENLEKLNDDNKKIILRCPIIPTVNDTMEHFNSIKELKNKYSNIIAIEILPYHDLGSGKEKRYSLNSIHTFPIPTQEQKDYWNEIINN